jgi:hypothetical protein
MAPALENSMSTLPSSRAHRDPRFQRGGVGDIHGRAGRLHARRLQLGNGAGDLIRVAGAHRDACAFARQRVRNRPPDAARAAEHRRLFCCPSKPKSILLYSCVIPALRQPL